MAPKSPLRLYRFILSGHSHRAQLMLSLLRLPHELIDVDLSKGEQKQPGFIARNVFGQVPVLQDGDLDIPDSNAILIYLCERYDSDGRFLPRTPEGRAGVQRWLTVAAGPLVQGPVAARAVRVFKRNIDHTAAVANAAALLGVMEGELGRRHFLVGDNATVADVALYTYVAHAPEGDVSLDPYPNVRAWLSRIEALPGFVPMQAAPKRTE